MSSSPLGGRSRFRPGSERRSESSRAMIWSFLSRRGERFSNPLWWYRSSATARSEYENLKGLPACPRKKSRRLAGSGGSDCFLDANVLFSAALRGPAFELLWELERAGRIRFVTSRQKLLRSRGQPRAKAARCRAASCRAIGVGRRGPRTERGGARKGTAG